MHASSEGNAEMQWREKAGWCAWGKVCVQAEDRGFSALSYLFIVIIPDRAISPSATRETAAGCRVFLFRSVDDECVLATVLPRKGTAGEMLSPAQPRIFLHHVHTGELVFRNIARPSSQYGRGEERCFQPAHMLLNNTG